MLSQLAGMIQLLSYPASFQCVHMMQMDEEGAEKISTVQEAADAIVQQIDSK